MDYNYAKDSAISAEREVTSQKLAEGESHSCSAATGIGLFFPLMITAITWVSCLFHRTQTTHQHQVVGGGSKYFFIDSSENTTDEQRQAAKDFLNWLVSDPEGNAFLTDDCQLVPAYSNIAADNLDPLGTSVKSYADAGNLIPNYNFLPDDHYRSGRKNAGIPGRQSIVHICTGIVDYWKTAQVILTNH